MREIKFRAWHEGMWRDGFGGKEPQMLYDNNPGDCLRWKADGQNITDIMQFTGIHDKNGVEIYEGDILRWCIKSTNKFLEDLLEVKWGSVGWVLKSPMFSRFGTPKDVAKCSEINTRGYTSQSEVIGNIHENPELLKEAK